ncbi:MAG TPA: hydrogenase assembly protein HupF [candidate division Zixibacteria bacterium]|nr:hydrogenase assembly protein HupF [candidate division Zixibacteria bacterium]
MCLAIPGKIMEIIDNDPIMRTGKVSFGGIVKDINLAYVPEAGVDDYVIVHAGFAISQLDEKEANEVFGYLKEIGAIEELLEP